MKYASFWQRLLGHVIDFAIILAVFAVHQLVVAGSRSRAVGIVLVFPARLLPHAYVVWFHAKWGRTLGKMVARAKVVSRDGFPIGWEHAAKRSAVGIAFTLAFACCWTIALLSLSGSDYTALTWAERNRVVAELNPMAPLLAKAWEIWFWSELVVMLLNRERRALHDFIADTVVVDTRAPKKKVKEEVRLLGGIRYTFVHE